MFRTSLQFSRILFCKKLFPFALTAAIIGLSGIVFVPNNKISGQAVVTQSCATCRPPTQQVIYTPLVELKESSFAEINLNCRSSHPIDAVPTFYTVEGMPVVGETIHLLPAEMRFVDVHSLIPQERRGNHNWGGMSLTYTGNTMEIWAQMTFHGASRKGSVNSFFAVVDAPRSDAREAVWRMPKNATATIALGNYSDAPAAATLTFSNGDVEQINLAPYATEIVRRRNNGQNRTNIEAESAAIYSSGQTGRLITTGFVSSDNGDFGSTIRFADTRNVAQPNLYATNFRLKDTTAHIVLKNTTTNTITARPRFLPMAGEGSGVVELPAVTIPPSAVKEVNLTALTSAARTRRDLDSVSVQIISDGAAGSLIGAANFTNNVTGVDYDIPLRDSGTAQNSAGGYPVRLDDDYTTILSITNVGDRAGKFTLQINFDGGVYAMYPRELAPGATAIFDIRKLRDNQTPDSSGRLLPLDLTIGQIRWSQVGGSQTRLIGRSEVVSKTGKVSSSYSCGVCCPNGYYSGRVMPNTVFTDIGDYSEFIAEQQDIDCYNNLYAEYPVTASWTSSDNTIADIDSDGVAAAVGVGKAFITGAWDTERFFEDLSGGCDSTPIRARDMVGMIVQPKITKITPDRSVVNRTVDVTIDGSGFAAGATVQVSGSGVTVPPNDVVFVSASKITAKFTITANAAQGERDVTVTVNTKPSKTKKFLVQVPDRLEVFSDTGNVPVANCASTVKRDVVYKIIDQDNKEIRQAVDIIEDLSGVSTNSCGNGLPVNPSCTATQAPPPNIGTEAYLFDDGISVNYSCMSPVALQTCQSNPSCGYTYTQKWKTCGNDGNIQLYNVSGSTFCNQIKLNGSTQFSMGTRPPK